MSGGSSAPGTNQKYVVTRRFAEKVKVSNLKNMTSAKLAKLSKALGPIFGIKGLSFTFNEKTGALEAIDTKTKTKVSIVSETTEASGFVTRGRVRRGRYVGKGVALRSPLERKALVEALREMTSEADVATERNEQQSAEINTDTDNKDYGLVSIDVLEDLIDKEKAERLKLDDLFNRLEKLAN